MRDSSSGEDGASPSRDTPIRRQYQRLKSAHEGRLLLFQLGDFFECFEEDARTLARVCAVTLTSREFGKGDRVPLSGIPLTRLEHYLARLLEAGLHVAIAEQVSPAGAGLVEREVTRVVTPGTLAEPGLLREKENNFLASVVRGRTGIGLAYVDVSTGEFATTQVEGDAAERQIAVELERLAPAELLICEGQAPLQPGFGHVTVCQPWRFQESSARERLCAHFRVRSLEGFGCAAAPLAVSAAGAILSYLEEQNRRLLPHIATLRTFTTASGMPLDASARRTLELLRGGRSGRTEGSLLGTLDRTRTPMGGRLLRRWIGQPLLDLLEIEQRLDAVETLLAADELRQQLRAMLGLVGDLERALGRVTQGVAGPRELRDLAESLRTVDSVRALMTDSLDGVSPESGILAASRGLLATIADLDPCQDLIEIVTAGVAPPQSGRWVRPGYSEDLDELVGATARARQRIAQLERVERERTGIKSLKVGFNKVFGYYFEVTRPNLSHVPPEYHRKQTLAAGERFTTSELKESEVEVLQGEERIESVEREVFQGILRDVAARSARVLTSARALAHLDLYACFADVARDRHYSRPKLDRSNRIVIRGGRHPVVETHLDPGAFIENDCNIGDECRLMILTGPNMAGKSTFLRQIALIALMAQIGSFVPAREAHLGLVDRIFTRVGAQDDIAAGASTFMVEMMEAANILRHATERSLIVLDEIGRGTSTFDGLSIARALVEEISQRVGARTLFATHFHELSGLAEHLPGVQVFNVAVAENGGEVVFLHRVSPGATNRSYGIQVARLAGLPAAVTLRAEEILRELETRRDYRPNGAASSHLVPNLQLELDGFDLPSETAASLLASLLALDLANLTPLEALNQISEVQRRADRR